MLGFKSHSFETRINRLYDKFRPFATRFGYTFVRPSLAVNGRPNVVFLGNHSSGKSSFINHLLEDAPVQDTGVAPTDDGFTVLIYSSQDFDVNGPAALAKLPPEFSGLSSLGPSFLQRLRVKARNRPVLKRVNLIDSPGMIDSAAYGGASRDYDFTAAVRHVSEISDLILFMFDPDKPGTTGETVSLLRNCISGMEFKLRILMNKCDTFDSMYDFARAYGALCWNLAHVLKTKDLPTVYTTYLPVLRKRAESRLELTDFDRHRGLVTQQIENAAQRRTDNLIAGVQTDFARLDIQSRMILRMKKTFLAHRIRLALASLTAVFSAGTVAFLLIRWRLPYPADHGWFNLRWLFALVFALILAILSGFIASYVCTKAGRRFREKALTDLDSEFADEYAEELATGRRDDLRQNWKRICDDVRALLSGKEVRLPTFAPCARANLRGAIEKTIPALSENA